MEHQDSMDPKTSVRTRELHYFPPKNKENKAIGRSDHYLHMQIFH